MSSVTYPKSKTDRAMAEQSGGASAPEGSVRPNRGRPSPKEGATHP